MQNKHFLKNTFWIGFFTVLSRALGYVRERMLAYYLGVSMLTDCISIALKLPSFFRRILAEGAFSSSFLPVFSQLASNKRKSFFLTSLVFLCSILLPLLFVSEVWTEEIISTLLPKLQDDPEKLKHVVSFTKITFPFIFFISIATLMGSVLQAYQKFKLVASGPFWGNATIIISAYFLIKKEALPTAKAIVVSAFLCGVVQLFILVYPALKLLPKEGRATLAFKERPFRDFLKNFLPGVIGSASTQINILIETAFLTFLGVGGASYIAYADRAVQLLIGIVSTSLSTTLLPALSSAIKEKNLNEVNSLLRTSLHICFLIATPAVVAFFLFGKTLVAFMYNYGAFKVEHINPTAEALQGFAIGLPAFFLVKVFATVFFANKDTRSPSMATFIAVVVCLISSFCLVHKLQHLGLTLATSLGAYANLIILFIVNIKKRLIPLKEITGAKIVPILFANCLFFAILWTWKSWFLIALSQIDNRFFQTVTLVTMAVILYFLCCFVFGLTKFWRKLFKR